MPSSDPLVSVIVPTYNHQDFVLSALNSVFAQSYRNFEIIVINDGSPDNTHEILQPLTQEGRIKYFLRPNAGQSSARNLGAKVSKGDYLAFLDDDDLWPAGKLEWQVKALETNPAAVVVYGPCRSFESSKAPPLEEDSISTAGVYPNGKVYRTLLYHNWIVSPGQTLIRRSTFDDLGGFDEKLWGVDDYDLYLRLANAGTFESGEKCALFYRKHPLNASRNLGRMYTNIQRLRRKHLRQHLTDFRYLPIAVRGELWYRRHFFILYTRLVQEKIADRQLTVARDYFNEMLRVYPIAPIYRSFWRCVGNYHRSQTG